MVGLRAFCLRFGVSIQRRSVTGAYADFFVLWLDHLGQKRIPNVATLCGLAVSHQSLPVLIQGSVAERWQAEVGSVLGHHDTSKTWVLSSHELADTVRTLATLPAASVVGLVEEVERLLSEAKARDAGRSTKHAEEATQTEEAGCVGTVKD